LEAGGTPAAISLLARGRGARRARSGKRGSGREIEAARVVGRAGPPVRVGSGKAIPSGRVVVLARRVAVEPDRREIRLDLEIGGRATRRERRQAIRDRRAGERRGPGGRRAHLSSWGRRGVRGDGALQGQAVATA